MNETRSLTNFQQMLFWWSCSCQSRAVFTKLCGAASTNTCSTGMDPVSACGCRNPCALGQVRARLQPRPFRSWGRPQMSWGARRETRTQPWRDGGGGCSSGGPRTRPRCRAARSLNRWHGFQPGRRYHRRKWVSRPWPEPELPLFAENFEMTEKKRTRIQLNAYQLSKDLFAIS